MAVRFSSSAGRASAIVWARSQPSRAALTSRLVAQVAAAHVPAVGGVQIAGGLQMFGDQRRVLLDRYRVRGLRSRQLRAGEVRRDPI